MAPLAGRPDFKTELPESLWESQRFLFHEEVSGTSFDMVNVTLDGDGAAASNVGVDHSQNRGAFQTANCAARASCRICRRK
jgi:hypothetical protein